MAQRDNMPEGTDSIIEGASGASSTSPSNADVVGGSFGSGGAAGLGGASGAGLSSGATGAIGGANTGGSLQGDYGSSSGTTGLGGASGAGSMGSTGGFGSEAAGDSSGGAASGGGSGGLSGGVQNLKSQAGDKARQAAVQGKERATDALGNVSTLVRDAAGMIDERLGGGYGDYARNAAGAIDSFADQLRNKQVDEILDDAKNLVRKSPGVAIGIAATVGFVLVRALKAGTDGAGGMGSSGDTTGQNALATDTMGSPANDGATPPFVSDRGGIA